MPADDQLPTYGRFYMHSAVRGDPDYEDTKKPVFHDVLMCEIAIKGDKNTSISKRVFENDGETPIEHPQLGDLREAYPIAWGAFKTGNEDYMEGSPLGALPGIGLSMKRNLQADGIMNLEDLAGLPDSVVSGKAGISELRAKAIAYLAAMEPEKAAEAEAERQAEMDDLKAQIAELQAAQKPKRGRPKQEVA